LGWLEVFEMRVWDWGCIGDAFVIYHFVLICIFVSVRVCGVGESVHFIFGRIQIYGLKRTLIGAQRPVLISWKTSIMLRYR
jgi:hypothetical protein